MNAGGGVEPNACPPQTEPVLARQGLGQGRRVGVPSGSLEENQGAGHDPQRLLDTLDDGLHDFLARPGRREIAGDVEECAPGAVRVVVLDPLQHVGDALLDGHQERGQDQPRAEGDDVLAGLGHSLECAVEERIQQDERHAAQKHGSGRRDRLADEDLDVPQTPLQDRVGERQRDEDERNDRYAREQRRLQAEGARQGREDQEGREPHDDPEGDPADLFLGLGVLAAVVQQLDQSGQNRRNVQREIEEPEAREEFQQGGNPWRGRRPEKGDLAEDVDERRDVEQRDETPCPDGSGEDQKEMKQQGGQERSERVFDQPERLPPRIAGTSGRQDVDGEGRQGHGPEQQGRLAPVTGDREEADDEVEEAHEGEKQVGRVEANRRRAERDAPHLPVRDHDQTVGEGLASQLLFGPRQGARGLAVGQDDPVSRTQSRALGRAAGLHAPENQRAAVGVEAKARRREAVHLPGEGNEGDRHRPQRHDGEGGAQQSPSRESHATGFSNPNATVQAAGSISK
jgi:hypothetical protein